ncbi:MAG: hypothetical protein MPEBLZ_00802, partial [Candidatus Methanoperedens nitroreducens]
KYRGDNMKKSILIGISIVTVLGILIAAVALGFGNPGTKSNSFANTEVNEPVKKEEVQMTLADTGISDSDPKIDIKGAIQYAQSNVSFRIIEPSYIPSGYKFESIEGKKFKGATTDIDMASFSYKNEDEQLTIKETLVIKTEPKTEQFTRQDTREIVDINGIEGRYSEENGIKIIGWKIGNLSLSVMSWKNEGQNQTSSSLNREEMIKMARSIK